MSEHILTLILIIFGTPTTIELVNSDVLKVQSEQPSQVPSQAPSRPVEGLPVAGPAKESAEGAVEWSVKEPWRNNLLPDIRKIGAPDWVNERVEYAYHVSGGSIEFVSTIESENSEWTTDRLSNTSYLRNGKRWYDVGICQISQYYHPKVVADERFGDWKWQIDQCWKMFKGGTKFYGNKSWKKNSKRFEVGKQ